MKEVRFENIMYGELLEVASQNDKGGRDFSSGYHTGMKVHFFNRYGVFVGNIYKWVPYSSVRFRSDSPVFERHFMIKGNGKYENATVEYIKMAIHKMYCKIITILIRKTQFA